MTQPGVQLKNGSISLVDYLVDNLESLFTSKLCSDVVLIVGETRFPVHKNILAARSEYFRALLCGDMIESRQQEITLDEGDAVVFEALLRYFYTGQLDLKSLCHDQVVQLFRLCDKCLLNELKPKIFEYLTFALSVQTFADIYGTARSCSLEELINRCLQFADDNPSDVLKESGFLLLPMEAIEQIIRRDTFAPPEDEILDTMRKWIAMNGRSGAEPLLSQIRLWHMATEDLLGPIRKSGLFSDTAILDAISIIKDKDNRSVENDFQYRGKKEPNHDLISSARNAEVVKGQPRNNFSIDKERSEGVLSHPIVSGNDDGIVIKLGGLYWVNHIQLSLYPSYSRAYSYYIEVSANGRDWTRVVDYSEYFCRNLQELYFQERSIRFIRVQGTRTTHVADLMFSIRFLEAMYCSEPVPVEEGCLVPRKVLEDGAIGRDDSDLARYVSNYLDDLSLETGDSAVIHLQQPYVIDSVHLWLAYDLKFTYIVETSVDKRNWRTVSEKRDHFFKTPQCISFERHRVSFIRITFTNLHHLHQNGLAVIRNLSFECSATQPEAAPGSP